MADQAARALSLPVYEDDNDPHAPPNYRRATASPSLLRRSLSDSRIPDRPRTAIDRWTRSARRMYNKSLKIFFSLTPLQRVALVAVALLLFVFGLLFIIYNHDIFAFLTPMAKSWRDLPGGWLILWFMVVLTAFPPMIGYSTCVTIAGFVWGMKGWLIVASSNIVGSTLSFLVSRTLLKSYVSRMAEKNKRFTALSLVLKHDGLKLLVMIRLCPLPYSLSNGAISTIPTVTWYKFLLATALATPKLALHVFIGSQIAQLAEQEKMDTKTKVVSYISIAVGAIIGVAVGWFIYVKTKQRVQELEAEEANAIGNNNRRSRDYTSPDYEDDPAGWRAANAQRRRDDEVSLHTTRADDDDRERGYRDEFTDDEDARERDVFDIGDGEFDGEDEDSYKDDRR